MATVTGLVEHASFIRPCFGEMRSGDAAFVAELDSGTFVAMIDVLGHGDQAYETAVRILDFLSEAAVPDVVDVMVRLNEHLNGSIGAAAGLCFVEPGTGVVHYTGVGNTVIRRLGSSETKLISQDGVIGSRMRSPREHTLTLQPGDLVLLHTDGVSSQFRMSDYPELLGHGTQAIAAQLVKRFGKLHDDAGCIVLRYRR